MTEEPNVWRQERNLGVIEMKLTGFKKWNLLPSVNTLVQEPLYFHENVVKEGITELSFTPETELTRQTFQTQSVCLYSDSFLCHAPHLSNVYSTCVCVHSFVSLFYHAPNICKEYSTCLFIQLSHCSVTHQTFPRKRTACLYFIFLSLFSVSLSNSCLTVLSF